MKKVIFAAVLLAVSYQVLGKYGFMLEKPEPLYNKAYIEVYGLDSNVFTQELLHTLEKSGISFTYRNLREDKVSKVFHARMNQFGLDAAQYDLPVVDVNNHMLVRPDKDQVITTYFETGY